MRAIAILVGCCLFACTQEDPGPGGPPGTGGPGGPSLMTCRTTADCDLPDVCTRTHECLAPEQTRSVLVRWTVQGAAANASSCATVDAAGRISIVYSDLATGEETGFSPLMCSEGQFFVDVWPLRYDHVRVAAGMTTITWAGSAGLPPGNVDVTVDLQPQ